MAKPDLFDPAKSPGKLGLATYRTIAHRLEQLNPSIALDKHVSPQTLEAHDSALDGINFIASDKRKLSAAFESAQDSSGSRALISMKEDPDHWALKASFGATVGTGWREIWRPVQGDWAQHPPGPADPRFRLRFGNAGTPLQFTALHCAVNPVNGSCNVHIDESGFMLETSTGAALTLDSYGHVFNELLLKTKFRDWLSGQMPNETAREIVESMIRRTTLHYESAANGYAGLDLRLRAIRPPSTPYGLLTTIGRLTKPLGASFDVFEGDDVKVQVTGSAGGGQRTIALTVGGEW